MKNTQFQMRISEEQRDMMKAEAEAAGFQHVAKFVLNLVERARRAREQSPQPDQPSEQPQPDRLSP